MTSHDTLKPREIEVLRLMAEGLTNREIGERLFIGAETVKWYAKQIYSKLDVSSRQEASEKAENLGLFDNGQPSKPEQQQRHNLPVQLTSFIGREPQIEAIKDLLNDTRLLTLTGPGGTGKTRLSIRAAEGLLGDFADGVYFVDLAPISKPEMVANAIANTLQIFESSDQSIIDTIVTAIGQRELLLILDNYEHVMASASLVADLLTATPNIKIIVTSREPLHLTGEQEYPIPPLDIHEADSEAVMLFVQRAQMVRPSFRLNNENRADIVAICKRVDGLPLAIELAAARCKFLTPQALLKRLDSRLQSLTGGSRDAPKRQQTLQATIDWSYNLLDEGERTLFERLAVFCCEFSLEAIETICGANLAVDVFDGLASLVDKSMVRQIEDPLGEPRFVMLETIQEYAWERLTEIGEVGDLRQRHAYYFADLTTHAQPFLRQRGQEYWFPRLDIEYDNIRSALQWSLMEGDAGAGMRIVASLQDFWFYAGYHIEGLRWAEQALEHLETTEPLLQAFVLETLSMLSYATQDLRQSIQFRKQALSIAHEISNEKRIAWIKIELAQMIYDSSEHTLRDYNDTVSMCEDGISILRKLGDKVGLAQALNILGNLHRIQGEFEKAYEVYQQCLQLSYETGEQYRVVMSLGNLCKVAVGLGEYDEARKLGYEATKLAYELNFTYMSVLQLGIVSPIALLDTDNYTQAAKLLGASAALRKKMNIRHQPNNQRAAEEVRETVMQVLGEADFQIAYEAGEKMSLEDAVALALKELVG